MENGPGRRRMAPRRPDYKGIIAAVREDGGLAGVSRSGHGER